MDDLTPPWPEHDPRDTRPSSRREHTTPVEDLAVVHALTDRIVVLEDLLRRLTYLSGDGRAHSNFRGSVPLDLVLPERLAAVLVRLHPRLPDEEG